MERIRTVIIDDEENARVGLYSLIQKYCHEVEVVGMAKSADQGKMLIAETGPDLVLLDIQMPGKTGFAMLQEIEQVNFDVIFVTGYDEYALKAFRYSALDYLLKPVNIAELQMAVSKYGKFRGENIAVLIENLNNPQKSQKIVLKHSLGVRYAYDDEIIRCESNGNYTTVYFTDETKLLLAKTLKEFESILPPEKYMRIHQSHIINVDYVKAYLKGRGGDVEMFSGTRIPVARSRKKQILDRLAELGK